jgi:hypothetical protein
LGSAGARDLIANPLRARKKLIHDFEMATLAGDYLTISGALRSAKTGE